MVIGHGYMLPVKRSEKAGGEILGQTKGEYWVSRGSVRARQLKETHSSGKTRKGKQCVVQAQRQHSVGLTELDFTIFHKTGQRAGYEADSAPILRVLMGWDRPPKFCGRKTILICNI